MDENEFAATSDGLLSDLDDLVRILRRGGEDRWADWITADPVGIAGGDRNALHHFLAAFGGMGSLNDVVLRSQDGRVLDSAERRTVEEHFSEVKDAAWTAARSILRALDDA